MRVINREYTVYGDVAEEGDRVVYFESTRGITVGKEYEFYDKELSGICHNNDNNHFTEYFGTMDVAIILKPNETIPTVIQAIYGVEDV